MMTNVQQVDDISDMVCRDLNKNCHIIHRYYWTDFCDMVHRDLLNIICDIMQRDMLSNVCDIVY